LFSSRKSSGTNEILQVGDYCACPSESEDWYRGLIRQLDSNGHAIVFKLDYGDVQCIPVQFLQPLQVRKSSYLVKICCFCFVRNVFINYIV
jgi:hypothetical protein